LFNDLATMMIMTWPGIPMFLIDAKGDISG
jgi:hypothetical protein